MTAPVSRDWTVQETLQAYPDTVPVLARFKTNCVGCPLARFCSLEDVSVIYGLPIEALLERLSNAVPSPCLKESEK